MPVLKENIRAFQRFVKIQSSVVCLKTIANHGMRRKKQLFLSIFTCASSPHCGHTPAKKITLGELPLGHGWQTTGCSLKDGSPLTDHRLGVTCFCCSWQPPEPLNVKSFIWVRFVNLRYTRPGFSPLTSPDSFKCSTELKFFKW